MIIPLLVPISEDRFYGLCFGGEKLALSLNIKANFAITYDPTILVGRGYYLSFNPIAS
jgi:hypothetical protein